MPAMVLDERSSSVAALERYDDQAAPAGSLHGDGGKIHLRQRHRKQQTKAHFAPVANRQA
jgi:hypothetical protein